MACQVDELSKIPQPIANLIHFNFCVSDLSIEDKKNFFALKVCGSLNFSENNDENFDNEQWFIDSVKVKKFCFY